MVMDFSAAEKDSGMKLCNCMLVRRWASLILMNFGSRGVTAASLLPRWVIYKLLQQTMWLPLGSRNWGRCVRRMVGFASCKPADALVCWCGLLLFNLLMWFYYVCMWWLLSYSSGLFVAYVRMLKITKMPRRFMKWKDHQWYCLNLMSC